MIKVLGNIGFVDLTSHCGGDLSVVNSARVSFAKKVSFVSEDDAKLIRYLMRERHGTPFEHNMFTFHVKAPIFVVREWQRHRIGSFNEMSGRYTELPAEWYVPDYYDVRTRVGKPGAYTYEPKRDKEASDFIKKLDQMCAESYEEYQFALKTGIAPEQARMFLHVNHYTEMYWTINARSLMNFISLRANSTAQWEIQQYAEVIEGLFEFEMPITADAFIKNNRIAP